MQENGPEILTQGGAKYYYHCRGYHKEHIYRWRAPSGAEVLVCREPVWYNDELARYDSLGFVPSFCKEYGITKTMKFYGVGDHGGGPTRKEIETLDGNADLAADADDSVWHTQRIL